MKKTTVRIICGLVAAVMGLSMVAGILFQVFL